MVWLELAIVMKTIKISRRHLLRGAIAMLILGSLNFNVNASGQTDTLVIYLSRTKNNKILAEYISKHIDADLAEIETATPYPQNYPLMRDQVVQELNNETLPPLKNKIDTDNYHRIVLVFPTWSMRLPPPIKTFLHTHNLQNKIIMPLNTNAGYGVGSGIEEITNLAPNSKISTVLSLKGGNERDGNLFVMQGETLKQAQIKIDAWLQN